jgi:hypothetical protein
LREGGIVAATVRHKVFATACDSAAFGLGSL